MGSGSTPGGSHAKTQHHSDDLGSPYTKRPRRETDEPGDAPSNKTRVRVTRACDECRRRKDRCDGQRPSCQPCLAAKRACTYNPSKKRGLRTGYVRSLEILLGFLLGSIDGLSPWISALLEGEVTAPRLQLKAPSDNMEDVSEFSMNAWRKSEVLKKLESVLSVTECHDDDDEPTDSFEGRLTHAFAGMANLHNNDQVQDTNALPHLLISPLDADGTLSGFSQTPAPTSTAISHQVIPQTSLPSSTAFIDDLDVTSQAVTKDLPDVDHLAVPPDWSYLLDLHFAKTHSWFPICHKHDLLRSAYTLANGGQKMKITTLSQRGDAAFLWATLAYSSQHNDTIDAGRGRDSENRIGTQELHETAKRLVILESGEYEIGHIRALLILALFEVARGSWSVAWVTIGQSVYIASSLKLLDNAGQAQRTLDEGVKRTLLGCIALETLLASRLNCRPHFRQDDIQKVGPVQTEGIEEWEPWQYRLDGGHQTVSQGAQYRQAPGRVLSLFSTFIDIVGLLNGFLVEASSGMRQPSLQNIDQQLDKWIRTMPQTAGDLSEGELSPQLLNLQLAIYCVDSVLNSRQTSAIDFQQGHCAIERCQRIRQLGGGLKQRIQGSQAIWMPPATPIYLLLSRESLGSQKNPPKASNTDNEWRLCQDSLSDAERAWRDYQDSTTNRSIPQEKTTPTNADRQIVIPQSLLASMRMPMTSHAPVSSERQSFRQSSFAQPPALSTVSDVGMEGRENGSLPLVDEQYIDNEAVDAPTAFSSAPKPNQGHAMELGSFPDALMGRMEETELFDSLATLDPTDWVANPPAFMRHLGDLRDVPTDIHSFFDPDPT
ncbi:hypothetical protein B0T10DRAFT_577500 [Thelonectria olida]|uniref:Zn(2)-C6 fungal-type domain-containing protein n=1 Tax=Thelonectria olida TaxID=1576542 RepID=A0A9P9AXR2_9HYPO|nr:hypothetical protein B0T10DRAFT_577500 [Thelonectria olida]